MLADGADDVVPQRGLGAVDRDDHVARLDQAVGRTAGLDLDHLGAGAGHDVVAELLEGDDRRRLLR